MFLGALAGLANAYEELADLPTLLKFENEAEIKITEVKKNGIVCKQIKVEALVQQHHRHLADIIKIINESNLSNNAKRIAENIFNIIGKAEAEVHGIPIEEIHFHEIGAVDSIIDICGAAYLLDKLNIDKSYLANLITGKGFVDTAHGLLPIPCPATKLILKGIPYNFGDEEGERLTPTGAAIIKYLNPEFELPPLIDLKTAYGPGEKNFKSPNLLRLSLCKLDSYESDIYMIETNIDDGNAEYMGVEFQNKLKEAGALDFYFTHILMKKGRPGLLLSVICKESEFAKISELILNFTTTIGLRYYKVNKVGLERKIEVVETEFGKFRVKVSTSPDGTIKIKPEADDILKYSIEKGILPNIISQKIIGAYEKAK
ncbi:MAG: nickel pincer cofactor biosynthesis protein LarC [Melioribacteraceae bacterium]|nr:nickel pincer cofactor biosynthesis protein LarC [Melioribacteraceae bacterium]